MGGCDFVQQWYVVWTKVYEGEYCVMKEKIDSQIWNQIDSQD